jgi:hypothetical protein
MCPVYDFDNSKIPLSYCRGQVEVDDLARILTTKVQTIVKIPPVDFKPMSPRSPRTLKKVKTETKGSDSPYGPIGISGSSEELTDSESVTGSIKSVTESVTKSVTESVTKSVTESVTISEITNKAEESEQTIPIVAKFDSKDLKDLIIDIPDSKSISPTPNTISQKDSSSVTSATSLPTASRKRPTTSFNPSRNLPVISIPSACYPVGGLLGSGLGFGLKVTLDNGEADGSSGNPNPNPNPNLSITYLSF